MPAINPGPKPLVPRNEEASPLVEKRYGCSRDSSAMTHEHKPTWPASVLPVGDATASVAIGDE
jgi:hypothetical protein